MTVPHAFPQAFPDPFVAPTPEQSAAKILAHVQTLR